jgi:hypothetical protein
MKKNKDQILGNLIKYHQELELVLLDPIINKKLNNFYLLFKTLRVQFPKEIKYKKN